MIVKSCEVEPVKRQASLRSSKTKKDVKPSLVSPSSLRSIKTKQDVRPSLVSPSSSIKASRSPFMSQKTLRRVASSPVDNKNAHREATKVSSSSCNSSKWTGNFILTVELRKKIITFRSIIDLPPLTGHLSITDMVIRTMKDLHKLCPEIVESSQILDMRCADVDKLLDNFYNVLKSIGDSWIDDHEWMIKSKYRNSRVIKNLSDQLVEKVLAALDGLIKEMNERLNMTEIGTNDDDTKKKVSPRSKTSSNRSESVTPRTVKNPPRKAGDFAISVSNLPRNVRMQTLVKLSPIDIKRVAIQNSCQKEAQSNNGDDEKSVKEKQKGETEKMEKAKEAILEEKDSVENETDDKICFKVSKNSELVLESLAPSPLPPGNATLSPPQPLPMATGKEPAAPLPPGAAALPPSQPLPMAAPPPGAAALPPPPPLRMAAGKGPAAPPPPPLGARGSFGAKKATAKLKRSTQLGNLYRFLKAKIEAKDPEARGSKGGIGSASAGGKQGMADALAEITKKSAYFKQIEADVQMYMKAINELKTEISKFQSKDMSELQRFHEYVESVLDKLTDETQVLGRCEGFPQNKLEAIRMAAALYSKLHGMIKELKNWKIEPPADQHLDKTERYFSKIKREIENLDKIKVEEEKKFKSHSIHFDFNILIQVKESMVDISSGCMELALKEKREAKSPESREAKPNMMKNKYVEWVKMLWRAFQFAYRVYTFAGGHDDRADELTRELSEEIKLILRNQ